MIAASRIVLPHASRWVLVKTLALLLLRGSLPAQASDGFAITRSTIAGGGATFSMGGAFSLGGTIGQPDAGAASGGSFALSGGFWSGALAVATPTPAATRTSTPIATGTGPPTATGIATSTATRTATRTATPSVTGTGTQPATPTASRSSTATATASASVTPSPSPTPSPTAMVCVGDCNGNQVVAVDELVRGVNIALGNLPLDVCPAFDRNGDQHVGVDELIAAVNNTLLGCPGQSLSLRRGPSLSWRST